MLACVCPRSSIHYICLQFLQSPEAQAAVTHESDWWTLWDDVSFFMENWKYVFMILD